MTQFWLDDALTSVAGPSRSNQLLLESLSWVHVNFDDNERISEAPTPTSTQIIHRPAGLVDGARENRLLPGYERNLEDGGSFNPATNILAQELHPPKQEESHVAVNHSKYLKYLSENGPTFMMGSVQSKETTFAVLLDMAEQVKVLSPADDPIPGDILLNMCRWRYSLCALINEMRTVNERFRCLGCSSGVYVLTSSSYSAFLRALAAEIADRPAPCHFPPPA